MLGFLVIGAPVIFFVALVIFGMWLFSGDDL